LDSYCRVILWIDRSRLASHGWRFVGAHLVLSTVAAFTEPAWLVSVLAMVGMPTSISRSLSHASTSTTWFMRSSWSRTSRGSACKLSGARVGRGPSWRNAVDTQLHALAIQLQPHFLFNALQFVAETAHEDLAAARRTLSLLRGLVEQAFTLEARLEVTVARKFPFFAPTRKSRRAASVTASPCR